MLDFPLASPKAFASTWLRLWSCLLCVLLALPTWPASASTELEPAESFRVALLPVELVGTMTPAMRLAVIEAIREGFTRADIELVEGHDVRVELEGAACQDKQCFIDIGTATGATHLVRTRFAASNRDYDLLMELVTAADGMVVATSNQRCEICGEDEVVRTVSAEAGALVTKLFSFAKTPPRLVVRSEPSGASVHIDGREIGKTPLDEPVRSGKHTVRVQKPGFLPDEREVVAVAGVSSMIDIGLQPERGRNDRRTKVLAWTAVGTGVAAMVGGTVLLAYDDRENRLRCSGNDVDADGDCRYLYDVEWGGAAMLALGAAATAMGAVLLILQAREQKRTRVQASLGPTGAMIRGVF